MNLLLLKDEDFRPDGTAALAGRRALHARQVLRASEGDRLRVGQLGGKMGWGEIVDSSDRELRLRVHLADDPPPRLNLDLVLALPRPKAVKKILPAAASMGVDRIVLVNACRVEKSYFGSKVLQRSFIEELLIQGLEQGCDTRVPLVLVRDRFRPFVEDELPTMAADAGRKLLLHPYASGERRREDWPSARSVIAVGPEGGWVEFEMELLRRQGFESISLGPRILRVEVAVPFVLGWMAGRKIARPP